jgi:uncharacterized oxidoreductase
MKLEGQKVLITGGSAGIGLALARAFLESGSQVAICGRDQSRLDAAARETGVVAIRADVASDDDLQELVRMVGSTLGGLSILVNNAGIQFNYPFPSTPDHEALPLIEQEIRINLHAPAKLVSLCTPLLGQASEAAIVNISSGLAIVPKASAPIYCATKAAMHGFSKALRYQFEDAGGHVKVFEVLPPLVDTDMTRGRGSGKISPEEVARATIENIRRDRYEIRVGKAALLWWINRLAPGLAESILRNN